MSNKAIELVKNPALSLVTGSVSFSLTTSTGSGLSHQLIYSVGANHYCGLAVSHSGVHPKLVATFALHGGDALLINRAVSSGGCFVNGLRLSLC